MRRSLFFTFVLASVQITLARTAKDLLGQHATEQVPGGFIVELSTSQQKRGVDVHGEFMAELDKRVAGKFVTHQKFDSPLFSGISVQLKSEKDLASLTTIPHVVSVRPIQISRRIEPVWSQTVSKPTDKAVFPDGQSTHVMTGVDKAHAAGFTGKGIKIGVIDTGIDYKHPNLGGAFGPGHKVAGGYDFVGDDYTGDNVAVPDDDPQDTCVGHGTHVAGIIGANPGNPFNISGVAYESELYAYRVFGCDGGVADDILVAALLRAHKDGADVITASIGISTGWSSTWPAVIASRIASEGKVVTIAAGNEGEAGAMFTGSPGTGKDVISVGSIENVALPYPYFKSSDSDKKMLYDVAKYPNPPGMPVAIDDKPIPVFAINKDPYARDVGCKPFGDEIPDLTGYAVLVSANYTFTQEEDLDCNWIEGASNLAAKNATFVIYYDSTDPWLIPFWGFFDNAVVLHKHEDAVTLLTQLAKNPKLTVSFPQLTNTSSPTIELPLAGGGLVSDFSNFGPSNELLFKPAISAPGGNITSTYLTTDGSWMVASGTSMATPFLAGSAALILQAKGKKAAKDVRNILQSTSHGVPSSKEKGALPQTLAQQGAGLVDVFAAIKSNTSVFPAELLTNDTAHWKSSHSFTIQNNGKKAQTYKLSHEHAGTTVTVVNGKTDFTSYPLPLTDAACEVTFGSKTVTVQPGKSTKVSVTIQPPKNIDGKTLPIVSGWINVRGDRGDFVKVSYMGVAGSLRKAQAISIGNSNVVKRDGGLPALIPIPDDDEPFRAQIGLRKYHLGGADWPYFLFSLGTPSHRATIDLVPADTKIKSTVKSPFSTKPIKRTWSWWWPGMLTTSASTSATDSYSKVPVLGLISDQRELHRSGIARGGPLEWYPMEFPTKFANGTAIPVGTYRLLLRVLRLGGQYGNQEDYDVYVSEPVGILPAETATNATLTTRDDTTAPDVPPGHGDWKRGDDTTVPILPPGHGDWKRGDQIPPGHGDW